MLYIVAGLVALALFSAVLGLVLLRRGKSQISQRLEDVSSRQDHGRIIPEEILEQKLPFLARLVGIFGWILPTQVNSETLRWELSQAGYRTVDAPAVFVGARLLSTAAFGVGSFLATTRLDRVQSEVILLTVLGIVVGYLAPTAFLRWKQAKRRMEITLALPDALDLMVICVEAGLGLNAAILKRRWVPGEPVAAAETDG